MAIENASDLCKYLDQNFGFSIKRKIKSIIIVLDYSFATLRMGYENDLNVVNGIEPRSFAISALADFKTYGAHVTLLVNKKYIGNVDNVKQFLPDIDQFISYDSDLAEVLSSYSIGNSRDPSQILFIASDRTLRAVATTLGFIALPHISIANLALRDQISLHFVRIKGDQVQFNRIDEIIPYYIERYDNGQMAFIGIASYSAITQAISRRLNVDILSLDISVEDPMLVHVDQIDEKTSKDLLNYKILFSEGRDVLLAMAPSMRNDAVPFHHRHGHFFLLKSRKKEETAVFESHPSVDLPSTASNSLVISLFFVGTYSGKRSFSISNTVVWTLLYFNPS
jgi:hypothetical protein